MGLFDRLRKREDTIETTPTPTPQDTSTQVATDVLLQALLNNETITKEQALTLPAVSGAVSLICNIIASMPVKLYKYKDGKVEEKEDDPRVKLLNGDTGDTLDACQLKRALVEDYLMDKGGYCYIRRNRNDVTGLFYVKPIYVQTIPNFKPIYKDYQILVLGEEHYKHEFIKLLRNTQDGATGVGLTQEVGKAIETAYDTLLYQLNMVKSGGNKKGFLKSQRKLAQDEINVLKQAWNRLYANNKENVVVLNNGLEFQESSNNAVEMQMNDSRKTLNDEINNLFHIYPNDFYQTFKEAILHHLIGLQYHGIVGGERHQALREGIGREIDDRSLGIDRSRRHAYAGSVIRGIREDHVLVFHGVLGHGHRSRAAEGHLPGHAYAHAVRLVVLDDEVLERAGYMLVPAQDRIVDRPGPVDGI